MDLRFHLTCKSGSFEISSATESINRFETFLWQGQIDSTGAGFGSQLFEFQHMTVPGS